MKGIKMNEERNYARIKAVVFVEMMPGETLEDAEKRFLNALPYGMDIVSCNSDTWIPEEEQ